VNTAADTVRVSVLGPLEVTDVSGRLVRVPGHRVRALLILLALDPGRVLPAPVIIERLWPDGRPADAANALQSLVSRLRAALRQGGVPDGVLESSPAGYRLALRPDAVDAVAFETQAREGGVALARGDAAAAATLLRAALGRWRGAPLAEVAGEEFARAPAARLSELRSAATVDRVEAELALGAADAALIGELRELTAADPLAERPAALLMRALAGSGRQADALSVYTRTRDQLADRLGVSPSPRLEQTYLAILRQEIPQAVSSPGFSGPAASPPAASPPAPSPPAASPATGLAAVGPPAAGAAMTVRRPPTSFVGRDDDVAGVLKRLAAERLVTLTGPGGVGKTRLSVEAAARLAVPVWFAELAPVTDQAEVPHAVLDAVGLRERSIARRGSETAGDPVGRLGAALADRDAVLVLDNCEHVIDGAAELAARLLSDCPGVRLLATSREPLRIPGEALYVVAPLPAPPLAPPLTAAPPPLAPPLTAAPPAAAPPAAALPAAASPAPAPPAAASPAADPPGEPDVPAISTYPAVRLFADRAAAVIPGFELDAANAAAVATICRTLDGMPLAIELAAPWLRTLTAAQLAERLADRFVLLTGGSRTALPRHQTLRAVVDWSWDLLSEPEQALARRLAVFPGGATLAAAERVAAQAGTPAADAFPACDVLPVLAGLVSKSILTRADSGDDGEPRYRMLETVRAYGLDRLAEAGQDTRTRDAFVRYYLDFAEAADPQLRTRRQARWFRALTAEQDNVNAALRWAVARGDAETALRLVRALGYYWVQRGHGEADALTREVLALPVPAPATQVIIEGRIICALVAAGWTWDIDSIREPLTEALAALDQFGGTGGSAHPLVAMAEPLLMQYDGAADEAAQQYERYFTAPDPWLRAMGQIYLSVSAHSLGKLDGAEDHCRAGLAGLRAIGEQWGVAVALTHLAEFTELRADHAASIVALTEATALGRELGVWGDLTYVDARLAVIYARAGDYSRARAADMQVQRAAEARGGQVDTDRWVAYMRAELAWREGDYAGAARCCEAVLAAIAPNLARWWLALRAQVKARLALAVLLQGDGGRCQELLTEALDDASAWWEHPALAAVIDACAVFVLHRGGGDAAKRAARLLGAAYVVRGAFDESSLDAPGARDAARRLLGTASFTAAFDSAGGLGYQEAVAAAREALAAQPAACR
jgi:predicted ATPase/DNA-binding SARP family transcriptional activator